MEIILGLMFLIPPQAPPLLGPVGEMLLALKHVVVDGQQAALWWSEVVSVRHALIVH